jgi:hypothetical protein
MQLPSTLRYSPVAHESMRPSLPSNDHSVVTPVLLASGEFDVAQFQPNRATTAAITLKARQCRLILGGLVRAESDPGR